MFQSVVILPLLLQTLVLSKEQNTIPWDGKNETRLDPDTFRNSITYCSPIADHTPCTEGESPSSGVHHYLNTSHAAHFECFVTDAVVGSALPPLIA
jgi:hypothetical protein